MTLILVMKDEGTTWKFFWKFSSWRSLFRLSLYRFVLYGRKKCQHHPDCIRLWWFKIMTPSLVTSNYWQNKVISILSDSMTTRIKRIFDNKCHSKVIILISMITIVPRLTWLRMYFNRTHMVLVHSLYFKTNIVCDMLTQKDLSRPPSLCIYFKRNTISPEQIRI